ncbi:hypothetical protein U0070_014141 [Myodes glareolus]|uniref:Uncharacterized protein n=1 Tax=Myodes glareolus TaxID=447135 RepID=A0AAW0JEM1_MYOGA
MSRRKGQRVIAIHEKLSNLAQIAELSLPSVPEVASNENIYESVEPEEKAVDTDMENMILECCSEIMALFSVDREPTPLTEVCACPLRLSGFIRSPFCCVNGDTVCVSNQRTSLP